MDVSTICGDLGDGDGSTRCRRRFCGDNKAQWKFTFPQGSFLHCSSSACKLTVFTGDKHRSRWLDGITHANLADWFHTEGVLFASGQSRNFISSHGSRDLMDKAPARFVTIFTLLNDVAGDFWATIYSGWFPFNLHWVPADSLVANSGRWSRSSWGRNNAICVLESSIALAEG